MVVKNSVLWDTTPRSLLKVNGRFGGTYRLLLYHGFLFDIFHGPEDGSDIFLPNNGCVSMDYTAL